MTLLTLYPGQDSAQTPEDDAGLVTVGGCGYTREAS
jgi:hypothetical protein